MSEHIGDRLPPPLLFDFPAQATPGEVARALLLITIDEDSWPRIAVISPTEISVSDERHVQLEIDASGGTCSNLRSARAAVLWCVLDGAAYSIAVEACVGGQTWEDSKHQRFEMTVRSVLRDFRANAPMLAGPTYRVLE